MPCLLPNKCTPSMFSDPLQLLLASLAKFFFFFQIRKYDIFLMTYSASILIHNQLKVNGSIFIVNTDNLQGLPWQDNCDLLGKYKQSRTLSSPCAAWLHETVWGEMVPGCNLTRSPGCLYFPRSFQRQNCIVKSEVYKEPTITCKHYLPHNDSQK